MATSGKTALTNASQFASGILEQWETMAASAQESFPCRIIEMKVKTEYRFTEPLNIQVLHIERVFFDELAASFDVFAHQRSEDGFTLGNVFEPY